MKKCAFTLVELLVVIAVIAVLTAVVLPMVGTSQENARATEDVDHLRKLGDGIRQYLQDHGETLFPLNPAPGGAWPGLVEKKYVPDWHLFQSPFDRRSEPADSHPVSYGINARTLGDGTRVAASRAHYAGSITEFIATSELILLAPAPDSTPEVRFSGTSGINVQVQPPPPNPRLGTHRMRNLINVLYADNHASPLTWKEYSDSTSNPAGLRRWFPLGF